MTVDLKNLEHWLSDECEETKENGPWTIEGPQFRTLKSEIYRASSKSSGQTLALKHYFTGDAQSQFEALQITRKIFVNTPGISAPRPWALKEGFPPVVAMDWIDGPTLEDRVQSFELSLHPLDSTLARAGEALRCIHDHGEKSSGVLDTDDYLNDLEIARQGLDELPSAIVKNVSWLNETAPTVSNTSLTTVDLHGDFKPANIIKGFAEIYIIDGHFRGHGPAINDAAQFLNHLSLDLYHPNRWIQMPSKERREDAFLSAYRKESTEELSLPLTWMRVQKLTLLKIDLLKRQRSPSRMVLLRGADRDSRRLIQSA